MFCMPDLSCELLFRNRNVMQHFEESRNTVFFSSETCPFKARLDVALGSLVCWLVTLDVAEGWNWMSTVVLFNPGHPMIL